MTTSITIPYFHTLLAPYHTDLDTNLGGSIFYRETFREDVLNKTNSDVRRYGVKNFTSTQAVVITYLDVAHHDDASKKHTFQIILATNGNETASILIYKRLDQKNAVSGYSENLCLWMMFNILYRYYPPYLVHLSNVGIRGKYVLILTHNNCYEAGEYFLHAY